LSERVTAHGVRAEDTLVGLLALLSYDCILYPLFIRRPDSAIAGDRVCKDPNQVSEFAAEAFRDAQSIAMTVGASSFS